jgi:type IV secretion system protein VirB8
MFGRKSVKPEEKPIPNLSWEADIVLNERLSRVLAWRVATAAIVMAFMMGIAIALLIPLKQVVPYVVTVDKMTGESTITPTARDFVSSSSLNDKHWIKSFLIARERYNFKLLQHDYDTVRALAGDKPWASYARLYDGDSGLDKKLLENTEITPTILSISLTSGGIATVRYELKTKEVRLTDPTTSRRIATLRYSYKPQGAKREAELIDNPLGFTVEAYQTDPEFVTETPAAGAAK